MTRELSPLTPAQIGELTMTQLRALVYAKPPATEVMVSTPGELDVALRARESLRSHWER